MKRARRAGPIPPSPNPAATRAAGSEAWTWVVLAAIVLFFVAVRVRLLAMPLERDEGEYAYAGQLLLRGIPPYRLAYNMKWPGIYLAYALVMAVFGQSTIGIHLGLLVVNAAAIVLVFLLARELFNARAGLAAAVAYGMLVVGPQIMGSQAHATHFAVVPALGGLLLLLRSAASRRRLPLCAAGLLLGLTPLIKQQAVFLSAFALLYVAWSEWRARAFPPLGRAGRVLLFAVCLVLPLLATCAWLAAAGVLDRFWFWTIDYARAYVSEPTTALQNFAIMTPRLAAPNAMLWVLAALGLLLVWTESAARHRAAFVTGFFIAAFLTICPGYHFREHYYVTWMPALAVLDGAFVFAGANLMRARRALSGLAWAPSVAFGVAMIWAVATQSAFLFTTPPAEASRAIYGTNPWPESVEIARYIRARTGPDDTIAVLGSEPQIYFYSGRRSATGYIYVYGLMEPQPYAHRMQLEMIREIERARPKFIVNVVIGSSWLRRADSDPTLFDWQRGYLPAHYQLAGWVLTHLDGNTPGDYHTDYVWDAALAARSPDPRYQTIYVLERK